MQEAKREDDNAFRGKHSTHLLYLECMFQENEGRKRSVQNPVLQLYTGCEGRGRAMYVLYILYAGLCLIRKNQVFDVHCDEPSAAL